VGVTTGADKQRSYNGDYMAAGKYAEAICLEFVKRSPSVLAIEDTRNLRVLREADVDCVMHLYDGRCHLAEFKSDAHLGVTGNVLFEVLRVNHTAPPEKSCVLGWSARSPAKFLLYFAPEKRCIYLCTFDGLRGAFQRYTRDQRKRTRLDWVNTDSIKSTVNVLIPWGYCEEVFTVHDVSDICEALSTDGRRN